MKIKLIIRKISDIIHGRRALIKGKIPYLEFNVVDHCNLNCAGCDHFCPLIDKKQFTDVQQFQKDIKELSKKLSIFTIRIMGGEPLLHPQLTEFIKITRKYYPLSDIHIVTNGILLPTMKDIFWETIRNYNIKIDFSKYPVIGDKFSQYLDLCADKNVQIGNIFVARKFTKFFNEKGDSDNVNTWNHCLGKRCANLWNSKLYQCFKCYISIANKYFDLDMPGPQAMDIYKMSGKQMEKICKKPSPACAYCNMIDPPAVKWDLSKKDRSEWF